jgi:DNA-directed RNA polymerase specialized sigma24 family protein
MIFSHRAQCGVELMVDVDSALEGLSENDRALCEYLKEHSIRETSRIMNIDHKTVCYRLKRIKRHFAAYFNK